MDRNNIIGLVLIFAIFAGSFYFLKPTEQELKNEQKLQDSRKNAENGIAPTDTLATSKTNELLDSAALSKPFGTAKVGQEQLITLENEQLIVHLSSKGGKVKSVQLKGEKNFDGAPLYLLEGDNNNFGFLFNASGQNINTNDLYFALNASSQNTASFRLKYNDNQYLEYSYSLQNGYNLALQVNAVGIQNLIDVKQKTILLDWETNLLQKEQNIKSEREKSTIFFKDTEGTIDHLSETGDEEEKVEKTKVEWIAFKQHFFSSILSSKQAFENTNLKVTFSDQENVVKNYKTTAELAFNTQSNNHFEFSFFFGPNQYKTLKAEGNNYEKIINMGWGPMGWINRFITVPLFDFLDGYHMSYGIVILILTLLLKGAMFPLTRKSYLSMAKMRVLKPQLDQIKEKVGEDNPMLLQQEQMKLYKQAGVNPLGGCLPMLLQMPFTLAFFFFFPNLFELRGQSFLWMKDLSTYDTFITFSPIFGINHISLMCVLMTAVTLLTTWYNNATSGATSGMGNQMKYIGYIMPLLFFFMLNSFPSGLNYYYFLGAVFTFLTQFIIRQSIDDEKILAKLEENQKNPKVAKKSSFQTKMEEMMRQQQTAQQAKKK
ncbi:YidC/Oxa1 family membrane protein insertase [Sphingobacterium nematocida]|uniref:Membrane protein insertase YidC n=1 Tax=Sphingobacterium nematocida TaxID=1513896 RepID=A0A1T5FV56_9SPHI|nr:membrane protein insertase YidC [Sphingobacterium nematocida]SKC00010.1 YidC/Oxa1 family membrane protein insertase [Sphingobacterium nematocida]